MGKSRQVGTPIIGNWWSEECKRASSHVAGATNRTHHLQGLPCQQGLAFTGRPAEQNIVTAGGGSPDQNVRPQSIRCKTQASLRVSSAPICSGAFPSHFAHDLSGPVPWLSLWVLLVDL